MELQKLSVSLLESLVAVVDALGKVAPAVAGWDGDVKLTRSSGSLQDALDLFTKNLRDTLDLCCETASGKALAKLRTTQGATRASVTSAASDWQNSVTTVIREWDKLVRKAAEFHSACEGAATMGGTVDTRDLQEKVDRWMKSVQNLVDETWRLPLPTDKEKAPAALKEYKAKVGAAKENTLEALKAVEEAVVATSQAKAANKAAERAENVLEPLQGLLNACVKVIEMFQELSCTVGDIQATLEATKEESPDVPKDLVDKEAQAERLWRASVMLVKGHLKMITGDIEGLLSSDPGSHGDPSGRTVAEKCKKAKADIPNLLRGQ